MKRKTRLHHGPYYLGIFYHTIRVNDVDCCSTYNIYPI